MRKRMKNFPWRKLFDFVVYSLVFFLIECITYKFLIRIKIGRYWMLMPVALYFAVTILNKFIGRKNINLKLLGSVCIASLLMMFFYLNIKSIKLCFLKNFELISSIIVLLFLINLIISKSRKNYVSNSITDVNQNKLFNLFYINTSKVHEIAMLIDNKIMKTVESEQISEELLKYSNSFNIGIKDMWSAESGHFKEDSTKKRVYENFDVKTTKSIMLRKIFDTIQKDKEKHRKLELGELTIFENIELEQQNIDDTVMILNILQDSKIKNDSNESLEINLNKMMDKMLDDFTIDYVFISDEKNNYIIQLPYKSTENFENGYQHNDLQLGKLSIIGIYRGEIDFSKKELISSRFLDLIFKSYHDGGNQDNNSPMQASNVAVKQSSMPFELNHKKLNDKFHLIDVIAIIQELNIDREQ